MEMRIDADVMDISWKAIGRFIVSWTNWKYQKMSEGFYPKWKGYGGHPLTGSIDNYNIAAYLRKGQWYVA